MTRQDLIRKISSRKFWALVAAVVVSALVLFNVDAQTIERIAALVTAFGAVVAYMFAEAIVDKEAVKNDIQGRE